MALVIGFGHSFSIRLAFALGDLLPHQMNSTRPCSLHQIIIIREARHKDVVANSCFGLCPPFPCLQVNKTREYEFVCAHKHANNYDVGGGFIVPVWCVLQMTELSIRHRCAVVHPPPSTLIENQK